MKNFLLNAGSILALIVVVSAIGLTIEWYRRRSLVKWAQEQGGAFEAGAFLDGASVPEGAPFDLHGEKVTYHNVTRIERPGASYVVAQYQTTWKNTKSEVESFSCVVCFITIPVAELPSLHVSFPKRANLLGSMLGVSDPPAPLPVPEALPAFTEQFQVTPIKGAGDVPPERIARLLPKAVQEEFVAKSELISGMQIRGDVVRIQAVKQQFGYPHKESFAFAERLVAAWTAKR